MRIKPNFILFILLIGIMKVGLLVNFNPSNNINEISLEANRYSTNDFLTDVYRNAEIEIISDENFTDYGLPGNGTADNPYRIENLNMVTTKDCGISIVTITKHLLIRNCSISAKRYGIETAFIPAGIL